MSASERCSTCRATVIGLRRVAAAPLAVLLGLLVSCPWASAAAGAEELRGLIPDAVFTQIGIADEVTMGTVGVTWNLKEDLNHARWGVYLETSLSRWQSRGGHPSSHGALTQIALIPVVRYRFSEGSSPWFVEGGIGATATSSIYRSNETRFSTSFNFGDHLGAGYSFGSERTNEVALRAEHFSNGGIKKPNPGKNFMELRYTHQFGR